MYSVYQPTGLMERLRQVIIPHYYTALQPQTVFDRKFLNSLSPGPSEVRSSMRSSDAQTPEAELSQCRGGDQENILTAFLPISEKN